MGCSFGYLLAGARSAPSNDHVASRHVIIDPLGPPHVHQPKKPPGVGSCVISLRNSSGRSDAAEVCWFGWICLAGPVPRSVLEHSCFLQARGYDASVQPLDLEYTSTCQGPPYRLLDKLIGLSQGRAQNVCQGIQS